MSSSARLLADVTSTIPSRSHHPDGSRAGAVALPAGEFLSARFGAAVGVRAVLPRAARALQALPGGARARRWLPPAGGRSAGAPHTRYSLPLQHYLVEKTMILIREQSLSQFPSSLYRSVKSMS